MSSDYGPVIQDACARVDGYLAHYAPQATVSQRLFHGRGKCFLPLDWVNIDVFGRVILVTVFEGLDIEAYRELCNKLLSCVQQYESTAGRRVNLIVQRRDQAGAPCEVVWGDIPDSCFAARPPLRFSISFGQQNVGFFLDIEPARAWLEKHAQGKSVLNLFAYTCAFSVVARHAGARSVVNIDLSRNSLARGRKNHELNGLSTENIHFFAHDIFKSWGKLRRFGPYDIVIIDPPSFQKGSFIARKDYVKVLSRMEQLVADGGEFLACLNSPEIYQEEFKTWIDSACPGFEYVHAIDAHEDFPERDPGRELKMLLYRRSGAGE